MKKIFSLLLTFLLLGFVSGCASGSDTVSNGSSVNTNQQSNSSGESDSEGGIEGIEVDEGLLTVDITFPESFVSMGDEELTQERVDEVAAEAGYIAGTLNSDGSVTYMMTKLKQSELLEEAKNDFDATIQETIADYPNVKSVTRNDDLSEITIEVTEQDLATSFLAFGFSFTAYFYQVLDGKEFATDIVFVDASTGEELSRTSYPMED